MTGWVSVLTEDQSKRVGQMGHLGNVQKRHQCSIVLLLEKIIFYLLFDRFDALWNASHGNQTVSQVRFLCLQ